MAQRWIRQWTEFVLPTLAGLLMANSCVFAQHADIGVFRTPSNQITAHNSSVAGLPELYAYERAFDFFGHPFGNPNLPKVFVGDDPGFQMSGSNVPAGYVALPANSTLKMDLLSFRLPGGGNAGNLFHWIGTEPEIHFGSVPTAHTVTVVDSVGARYALNGSAQNFQDAVIGVTDAQGGMHKHLSFELDDNDNNTATDPSTGFYLWAFEMTMNGLQKSRPVLVALSSPEIPASVEEQVANWMVNNLNNFQFGSSLLGDFDGNGIYNCLDVDGLVAAIAGGMHPTLYDLNSDGLVNAQDLVVWRTVAGTVLTASGQPILPADANLDGVVDGSDFGAWNAFKFTATPAWCSGDFNADGIVDGSDFGLWNANKFLSSDGSGTLVPEPIALVVLLAASLCMGGIRQVKLN